MERKLGIPKNLKLALALALLTGVIFFGHFMGRYVHYRKAMDDLTFEQIDITAVPDGKYRGECDVDFIKARVEVTVRDGGMESITLVEHRNERGFAAVKVVGDMLIRQSTDVDAVTGATNSSKVIRKAVENALKTREPAA